MITNWISTIVERLDGRTVAARFGSQEKNVENLLNGKVTNPRTDISDFFSGYLDNLPTSFGNLDEATRRALIDELVQSVKNTGPLSIFFLGQKIAGQHYPETIKLAGKLDSLSARLDEAKLEDSISIFKKCLLEYETLTDDYWQCPLSQRDMRVELGQTDDWTGVQGVVNRLRYNSVLSIIAMWDVEFCAAEFSSFEPLPLLLHVAPKIKSDLTVRQRNSATGLTIDIPKGYRGFGDIIDRPMSLLVDMTSCLLHRSEFQTWPDRLPKVSISAKILGTTEQKLAKLRSSVDRMTINQYQLLLNKKKLFVGDLSPLLVAAHIWEFLLLRQPNDEVGEEKKALLPDEDYLRFWSRHRATLGVSGYVSNGDIPWPSFWARRPLSGEQPEDARLY